MGQFGSGVVEREGRLEELEVEAEAEAEDLQALHLPVVEAP